MDTLLGRPVATTDPAAARSARSDVYMILDSLEGFQKKEGWGKQFPEWKRRVDPYVGFGTVGICSMAKLLRG